MLFEHLSVNTYKTVQQFSNYFSFQKMRVWTIFNTVKVYRVYVYEVYLRKLSDDKSPSQLHSVVLCSLHSYCIRSHFFGWTCRLKTLLVYLVFQILLLFHIYKDLLLYFIYIFLELLQPWFFRNHFYWINHVFIGHRFILV